MFTGVQIIGPRLREALRPVFSDTVRDAYIPALRAGADLRVFVHPGYFAEHSTPERYLAGNLTLLRAPSLIAHPPGPLTGVDPAARIAPTARIIPPVRIEARATIEAGATVGPDVVVGAAATVAANVTLTRTVLWPGTRATASLADAVITPEGAVTPV